MTKEQYEKAQEVTSEIRFVENQLARLRALSTTKIDDAKLSLHFANGAKEQIGVEVFGVEYSTLFADYQERLQQKLDGLRRAFEEL